MARPIAKTNLGFGILNCAVALYTAGKDDVVKLDSVCTCGKQPKMSINCACGAKYSAWQGPNAPPKRGYPSKPNDGKYLVVLSVDDVKAAKSEGKQDIMEVEKIIDAPALLRNFAVTNTYTVLPDTEVKGDANAKFYRIIVEALDNESWVLLTRLSQRGTTKRYAIVANAERNILLAQQIVDLEMPYEVPNVKVSEAEKQQAKMFFAAKYSDDTTFERPPDALLALIQEKLKVQDQKMWKAAVEAVETKQAVAEKVEEKPKKKTKKVA